MKTLDRGRKPSIENVQLRTLVESNQEVKVRELNEELNVSIWTIFIHLKAMGQVKKWINGFHIY